jgi:hypothetical protein
MKATELRIGNLVNYKIVDELDERKEWFEPCKIDAVDLQVIDSDYQPIPLTEECLLKFGFEKSIVKEPWFEKNKIEVFKYSKGNFFLLGGNHTAYGIGLHDIWQGMEINIQYVHQLQNIYFALTNEELTLIK